MRRALSFPCEDVELVGSLDEAAGATGLLLVMGGTQIRTGAHGGQSRLAARIAAEGYPVLRFDRRGVGDSGGDDPEFTGSAPDIDAAVRAFRAHQPQLTRIAALGICDGATAVALHGAGAGVDAMLLANPWVIEPAGDLPAPAAIRARYRARLFSPAAWLRLLRGGIDLRKAVRGLRAAAAPTDTTLAGTVAAALIGGGRPVTILLAERDNTAAAFAAAAKGTAFRGVTANTHIRDSASHGFAAEGDPAWLAQQVIIALRTL